MCGICGIIYSEPGRPVAAPVLQSMMHAIRHRGPDGEGIFIDGGMGFGHRRLAVIDLQTGDQPMCNEDQGLWITFNGEIYNYRELRAELEHRHVFTTSSDTEVILHLYEELGPGCLERLNGMFAFAIWDRKTNQLFAARDRLGIKPFYWHYDQEKFLFASEIKALFVAGLLQPAVDMDGLQESIAFQFCLGDRTMFDGISRLEPGCYLVFNAFRDEAPHIHRYWDLQYEIDSALPEDEFIAELRNLLSDSIRLQLRADVPVGAHLSGGIDSSAVVCLASALADNGFHSFTGAFDDGLEYDESAYARLVSGFAHTFHHEIRPNAQDFMDVMPWLIYMMDEPAAGPGLFPQYFVSKLAKEHVKVVLGGQGGDELFGGYARYLVAYLEQVLKGVIYGTQEQGNFVVTWENIAPNLAMLRTYQPMMQYFWQDGLFAGKDERYFRLVLRVDDPGSLYTEEAWQAGSKERVYQKYQEIFNYPGARSYFDQMTHFDIKTLLPALLQVEDRSSMSVSLESRVPLLDHRIVELLTTMPPSLRFKGGDSKRIFREAVGPWLPAAIRDRHDKMGFPVPLGLWAQGPLVDFLKDNLLGTRARQRGLYNMAALERLIRSGSGFGRELWGVLCLELWLQAFIDGNALSGDCA